MKTCILIMILATGAYCCPKGTVEYKNDCYPDLKPEVQAVAEVQPSSEKPSKHPEPAYQRGEVHADMPPSCDTKNDCIAEQIKANDKKARGDK